VTHPRTNKVIVLCSVALLLLIMGGVFINSADSMRIEHNARVGLTDWFQIVGIQMTACATIAAVCAVITVFLDDWAR